LLVLAAVIDWRTLRIPNWLTVSGMVYGLAISAIAAPAHQGHAMGALASLGGLAVGLVVLLPLYALRVMGAGDVKLMAMVGAFLGLPSMGYALLYCLMAGGAFALFYVLYQSVALKFVMNVGAALQMLPFAAQHGRRAGAWLATAPSIGKMPYGPAICAGTLVYLVLRQLG
jgi:prepilin peptidase CpaA